MHYTILERGLVAGITFFQREVLKALMQLRDEQYLNKTVYFKQKVY
jgi:hypothetical protein